MDSPATSDPVAFVDARSHARLAAPLEWEPALGVLDVPVADWDRAGLRRNGAALGVVVRRVDGVPRVTVDWPRSGPGVYHLELEVQGHRRGQTVTISPQKLGANGFAAMLEDLAFRLPADVAIALQRGGALAGLRARPREQVTLGGELERIRRAIRGGPGGPGLRTILPAIGRDPYRVLAARALWVPAERARRPDAAAVGRALVRADNLDDAGRVLAVVDRRVEHDVDVYENRVVATYVRMVRVRLRRVLGRASAGLPAAVVADARAISDELERGARACAFLADVGALDGPPTRPTMVLMRRPAYRAALDGLLAFLRIAGVELDSPALEAPLENAPALYQLWATLRVVVAVLEAAVDAGWRVARQSLVQPVAGTWWVRVVPDGRSMVDLEHPVGSRAVLVPERTYGVRGQGVRSVSFEQRPDVALEVRTAAGGTRLWLFDPKYKLEATSRDEGEGLDPVKADIDKMHAYRDAIRDDRGDRVVQFAGILYPGRTRRFTGDVAAIGAVPGREVDLGRDLHEVLGRALRL